MPVGKSVDSGLPVDQYLSKWPYFKIMFFLRDSMVGRIMSTSLVRSSDLHEARKETCSPSPSTSEFTSFHSECQSQELRTRKKVIETQPCPSFQVTSHEKPKRKRKRNSELENERLIQIEKEKLEVEKLKVQL